MFAVGNSRKMVNTLQKIKSYFRKIIFSPIKFFLIIRKVFIFGLKISTMALEKTKFKTKMFVYSLMGKSPTYHITENNIIVKWHNLDNIDNLPFDLDTYEETQLFLGHTYANPWKPDIEKIDEIYDEYDYEDPITDLIEKKHIIPSQRYKTLMNQNSLVETFTPSQNNLNRLQTLLYLISAGVGLLVLIQVT